MIIIITTIIIIIIMIMPIMSIIPVSVNKYSNIQQYITIIIIHKKYNKL